MKLTTQKTKLASLILLGISSSALAAPEFGTLPEIKREQDVSAGNLVALKTPALVDNGTIITDYAITCAVEDSAGAREDCSVPNSDKISFVPVAALGDATITWTATKSGEDNVVGTQKVTVSAESAPEIVAPAFTLIIENASDTVDATSLTAADLGVSTKDEEPEVTFSHNRNKESDKALGPGEYIFEWDALDGVGNPATNNDIAQKVTIKVKAEGETAAAPTFKATLPPQVVNYDPDTELNPLTLEVTENIDSGNGIKSIDYEPKTLLPGSHQIKWTVTNSAGMKASATQLINVVDAAAPVIPASTEKKIIEATSVLTKLDNVTIPATDNVAGDITATLVESASNAKAGSYESGVVNGNIADANKKLKWLASDENNKLTGKDNNEAEEIVANTDILIKPIAYLPLNLNVEKKAGNKIRLPLTGTIGPSFTPTDGPGKYSYLSNSGLDIAVVNATPTTGAFLELDIDASSEEVGGTFTVTIDEIFDAVYIDGVDAKQTRTLTLTVIDTPAAPTPDAISFANASNTNSGRLDVLEKDKDILIAAALGTPDPAATFEWTITPTTNVTLQNEATDIVTVNIAAAATNSTKYTLKLVTNKGLGTEQSKETSFYPAEIPTGLNIVDLDLDGISDANETSFLKSYPQFIPYAGDYITTAPGVKLSLGGDAFVEFGFNATDASISKKSIADADPVPHKNQAAKTFSVALSGVSGNAQFVVPLSKDVKVTAKPAEDDAGVAAKNDAIVTELMKLGTDGNFAAFDTTEDSIVYLKTDGHCPLIGSKAWTDAQKDDAEAPEMANCALITIKDGGANDLDGTTGRVEFAGELIGDVNEAPVIDAAKVAANIVKAESLLPDRIQVNQAYTVDMSDVVTDANGIQDPAKAADDDANKGKDKITYGLVAADVMVADPAGGTEKINLKPTVEIFESDETPGKFTLKVTKADTNSVLDLWVTATDGREQVKALIKLTSSINLAPELVVRAFKPEGKPGETVNLVAQEPNDPDGDNSNLTYKWTHIDTTAPVTITDSDKAEASFEIPSVADGTILKLQVEVTDKDTLGGANTSTATKVVEVRVNNRKPGDDDGSMFAFLPALLGLVGLRRRKISEK